MSDVKSNGGEVASGLFEPSAALGRLLDDRMHSALRESLEHLFERTRGRIDFDEESVRERIGELRAGRRFGPETFGRYFDWALGVLQGEPVRIEEACAALARCRPLLEIARPRVSSLGDPALAGARECLVRIMQIGSDAPLEFLAPTRAQRLGFERVFGAAMRRIHTAFPALAGEFASVVRRIVLVVGDESAPIRFDGGSSYMLWGALFLNVDRERSVVECVELLAHESAHSILFGLSTEEPLVENEPDERYASPLREDLRPMDGVFHALFASARMALCLGRMLDAGAWQSAEREEAVAALGSNVAHFHHCAETVRTSARMSPLGQRIFSEVCESMAGPPS